MVVHNHIGQPLGDITNSPARKRQRAATPCDGNGSDDDDNDDNTVYPTIDEFLSELHRKLPAMEYPTLTSMLKGKKIHYVNVVVDFDRKYYHELGMEDGAIGPFLKGAEAAVRKAKREAVKRGKRRAGSN